MATVADKRLDFIENYCTLSLRVKPDKWSKFATSEETHTMLNEFYEKPDVTTLVITLNPTGQLIPCLGFPSTLKNKGIYFVKKKHENITKDNFLEALLVGDISPSPVEQMMAIVEEVAYSLFMKRVNLSGWPRVVAEDVIRQAHRLKNEMFVMGGKIKGKTLLPLPENMDALDSVSEVFDSLTATVDSSLLHSIETIIIDWSHQIRDILSKDSAQPLLDGLNPLPRVEFDFWYSRQVNLQCINEQTRNFLSPEEVLKGLQGEIEEVLTGIKMAIAVIEKLYKTYDLCSTDMMPFFFKLIAVLREVKYLNFQQQKEIPDSAGSLFSQNETLQKFVDNLDLIVGWYNKEWSASPLFERKDNKETALLDLDGRQTNINKRYAAIKDAGQKIQSMVEV
ncbi:dynein heavy chain 17 axonemal [Crotalus adamanteus]|uniref:Dynein heavy chain 17 axonemal n=1 Tax=Crotalus adamanteus TaxID=8729 RepID=A0AAW1BZZ9_CROAD